MRLRRLPVAVRFMIQHGLVGFGLAAVFVGAVLWADPGGVGALILRHGGLPVIAALVNNDVTSLSYLLEMDCTVRPLTRVDPEGTHIYQRSLTFLLAKAVRDLFPDAAFSVDYAMGNGIYCSLAPSGNVGLGAQPAQVEALRTFDRAVALQMRSMENAVTGIMDRDDLEDGHQMLADLGNGRIKKIMLTKTESPLCPANDDQGHLTLLPSCGHEDQLQLPGMAG